MAWEKIKLGDVAISIQTGPFGSQLHQSDYSEFGTPVVMPKDMLNGKIVEDSIARVEEQHVNRLSRHKVSVGDILYARRGDVGKCSLVTVKEKGWLCGTGCLKVSIDSDKANSQFVFYQLQKPETIGWVEKHAVGATMLNLNTGILEQVPLELPDLVDQNRIVDILSAYDNLIENNQKQIKLLEEAAQRLYKQWFIDLKFPGHETTKIENNLPEGWRKEKLKNVIGYEIGGGWGDDCIKESSTQPAFVIRGTDFYGMTHGEISGISYRFHTESNLSARKLQDGDIVFEVSGGSKTEGVAKTVFVTQSLLDRLKEPVMCASFCKLIRIKNHDFCQYMYDSFVYMRKSGVTAAYDKRSASSIVNYRWKDFLDEVEVVIPSQEVIEKYNKLAGSMYQLLMNGSLNIETAKKTRDNLLPKLMSGKIEV